jgi:hypothetical protein
MRVLIQMGCTVCERSPRQSANGRPPGASNDSASQPTLPTATTETSGCTCVTTPYFLGVPLSDNRHFMPVVDGRDEGCACAATYGLLWPFCSQSIPKSSLRPEKVALEAPRLNSTGRSVCRLGSSTAVGYEVVCHSSAPPPPSQR